MNKMILFFLLLFSLSVTAQDSVFPVKDGRVTYERIVVVDSFTKEQLYQKVKLWAADYFKSHKTASKMDDKEMGMVSYNGFVSAPFEWQKVKSNWQYWFDLNIYLKDGKVKIVLTDVRLGGYGTTQTINIESYDIEQTSKVMGRNRDKYKTAISDNFKTADFKFQLLLESLELALVKPSTDFDF